MKLGSLFSGGGLGDLGWMMAGFDIRWQVEVDEYCRKVLDLRFPETKKHDDIRTFDGRKEEPVDIVAGGFPCQPFSVAGKQKGHQDDRNLWPEMLRVIREVRPRWVVAENVPGIISLYLDVVLSDLEKEGYAIWTIIFPAHGLGANHKRDRMWIIAYSGKFRYSGLQRLQKNIDKIGQGGASPTRTAMQCFNDSLEWRTWAVKPFLRREDDGVPRRVDRLKALGNGQVVACTAWIGQRIMEFEQTS